MSSDKKSYVELKDIEADLFSTNATAKASKRGSLGQPKAEELPTLPVLGPDDIKIAIQQIEDNYPLANQPLKRVLPGLCGRWRNKAVDEEQLLIKKQSELEHHDNIEDDIREADRRMNDTIKACGGSYEGLNYEDSELKKLKGHEQHQDHDCRTEDK